MAQNLFSRLNMGGVLEDRWAQSIVIPIVGMRAQLLRRVRTWRQRLEFLEFCSTDGEHRSVMNIHPSFPKVLMLLSEMGKV